MDKELGMIGGFPSIKGRIDRYFEIDHTMFDS